MYLLSRFFKKTLILLSVLSSLASSQSFAENFRAKIYVYFDDNMNYDPSLFSVHRGNQAITINGIINIDDIYYKQESFQDCGIYNEKKTVHQCGVIYLLVDADSVKNDKKIAEDTFLSNLLLSDNNKQAFERNYHNYNDATSTSDIGNIDPSDLGFVFPIQIYPLGDKYNRINILMAEGKQSPEDSRDHRIHKNWFFGLDDYNLRFSTYNVELKGGHHSSNIYFDYMSSDIYKLNIKKLSFELHSTTESFGGGLGDNYANVFILYLKAQSPDPTS